MDPPAPSPLELAVIHCSRGATGLSDVSLVVVAHACPDEDLDYLDGLAAHFHEAVFVDNGPNVHAATSQAWTTIVCPVNLGFGAAANIGASTAQSRFVLFLNPDARVDVATVAKLVETLMADAACAGVGPDLAASGSVYDTNAGGAAKTCANALLFAFGPVRLLEHRQIWRTTFPDEGIVDVGWLSGACLLFRRSLFLDLGGFPTDYFLYDEDVALGRIAQSRGYRLCVAAGLKASHRVGGAQVGQTHYRRWALSNQRHVAMTADSDARALATLALICIGLVRRAFWPSFLGRSQPQRYAFWAIYYLVRYRVDLPPAGPVVAP